MTRARNHADDFISFYLLYNIFNMLLMTICEKCIFHDVINEKSRATNRTVPAVHYRKCRNGKNLPSTLVLWEFLNFFFYFAKMIIGYSANQVLTTLCVRQGDVAKTTWRGSKRAPELGREATEAAAFNYHGTLASCGLRGGSAAGHCIHRGLIKGDVPSAGAA